ncbi:hypothetical protein PSTT_10429 [Puccinia striiformis]|uniref:Secreted protein n=1 Tax=Puccinia striiformis TaxID=27350 RepID=A0A2S4V4F5_9BASI|nr:hypothetical protein PSTT_10429 [Puccinia striiformis]
MLLLRFLVVLACLTTFAVSAGNPKTTVEFECGEPRPIGWVCRQAPVEGYIHGDRRQRGGIRQRRTGLQLYQQGGKQVVLWHKVSSGV